ncbi:Pam3-gp28 family putative phage holin [Rhizobium alvei]|uniref:Uncharacterized protein n=1 Tax=Rhizobium alvei TaxID=1132659 RepID=A0ABT8YTA4_9HYPH|nr:hypothetical protein [Rhizobium alvei]MDO6967003.1 hypothetical protein [Rhizobium alvei]
MSEIEQVARIILYTVGGSIMGAGFMDSAQGQTLLGACVALVSVGWWYIRQRQDKASKK